jgi:hypothetical protein
MVYILASWSSKEAISKPASKNCEKRSKENRDSPGVISSCHHLAQPIRILPERPIRSVDQAQRFRDLGEMAFLRGDARGEQCWRTVLF